MKQKFAVVLAIGVVAALIYAYEFMPITLDKAILTQEHGSVQGTEKIESTQKLKIEALMEKYTPDNHQDSDIELTSLIKNQNISRSEKIAYLFNLLEKFKADKNKAVYVANFLRDLRPVEDYKALIKIIKDKNSSSELRVSIIQMMQDFSIADTINMVSNKDVMYAATTEIKATLDYLMASEIDPLVRKQLALTLIATSPNSEADRILATASGTMQDLFSPSEVAAIRMDATLLSESRSIDQIKSLGENIEVLSHADKEQAVQKLGELVKIANFTESERAVIKSVFSKNEPTISNTQGYDGVEIANYGSWAETTARLDSNNDKNEYLQKMYAILIKSDSIYKQLSILSAGGVVFIEYIRSNNLAPAVVIMLKSNKNKLSNDWLNLFNDFLAQLS